MKKMVFAVIFVVAMTISFHASAQSYGYVERGLGTKSKTGSLGLPSSVKGQQTEMRMDTKTIPQSSKRYPQKVEEDLRRRVEDLEWSDEATAWELTCSIGTKDAYQKYVDRWPSGAHVKDATKKIIDFDVTEIYYAPHNAMPAMVCTSKDDHSQKFTITIENTTPYDLTVLFSGNDSRKVVIPPGAKTSVTMSTGSYRVAATVPEESIRPFADGMTFHGGQYDTGFYIVRM